MKKRLIELIEMGKKSFCDICEQKQDCEICENERIADHLLANNVVVLPLKAGDVVYQLAHGYAEEETVRCPYLQYLTNGYSFTQEDIGKTVFIGENAKAEAEAKLREMQSGN